MERSRIQGSNFTNNNRPIKSKVTSGIESVDSYNHATPSRVLISNSNSFGSTGTRTRTNTTSSTNSLASPIQFHSGSKSNSFSLPRSNPGIIRANTTPTPSTPTRAFITPSLRPGTSPSTRITPSSPNKITPSSIKVRRPNSATGTIQSSSRVGISPSVSNISLSSTPTMTASVRRQNSISARTGVITSGGGGGGRSQSSNSFNSTQSVQGSSTRSESSTSAVSFGTRAGIIAGAGGMGKLNRDLSFLNSGNGNGNLAMEESRRKELFREKECQRIELEMEEQRVVAEREENDARITRKVLDLEITNTSLLSINSSLELVKVRQSSEIRDLRRRLRESRTHLPMSLSISNFPQEDRVSGESIGSDSLDLDSEEELEELTWEEILVEDSRFADITRMISGLIKKGQDAIDYHHRLIPIAVEGLGRVLHESELVGEEGEEEEEFGNEGVEIREGEDQLDESAEISFISNDPDFELDKSTNSLEDSRRFYPSPLLSSSSNSNSP